MQVAQGEQRGLELLTFGDVAKSAGGYVSEAHETGIAVALFVAHDACIFGTDGAFGHAAGRCGSDQIQSTQTEGQCPGEGRVKVYVRTFMTAQCASPPAGPTLHALVTTCESCPAAACTHSNKAWCGCG